MKGTLLLLITCLLVLCSVNRSTAQLYEISLEEKVSNATLIVEGKVIGKNSFWNAAHTMIFTSNKVEVYKIFKGNLVKSVIEILTQGGSVNDDYIEASDLLELENGYTGVFFCFPNSPGFKSPGSANILFDIYSSSQGFLKYDLSANKAFAPFVEYPGIEGNLYNLINQKTGRSFQVVDASFKAIPPKKKDDNARISATATINSFSPATVNAGALNDPASNTLTIKGSGLGTQLAGRQLIFKDANNTNTTADYALESFSPYVNSWVDTQIVVRVPTRVATGKFGIVMEIGDTAFAPTNLEVFYAVSNAAFSSGTIVTEPRLMNANTLGGYSIVYSTETAGNGTDITTDSIYNNFREALRTWKEVAGVNFVENGNTTNQVVSAGDNINTIMFDNTNTGTTPLASGILATTYSSYRLCGGAAFSQKVGFDMVIRKEGVSSAPVAFPFNKSYCSLLLNTNGAEGTLLHELGHALNLGHIYDPQEQTSSYTNRNPAKLMHPTVTLSIARKALDQSSYAGSIYTINPQNNNDYGTCGYLAEMVPTSALVTPLNECPAIFPLAATEIGTSLAIDLDHATSNKYRDPQFTAISTAGNVAGVGVPVTNNAYYAIKTLAGGSLSFTITNYSTYPTEAQANCTEQGARIALYQVNSCPGGQNYPAPGYVTTFNSNTSRTVNGLSANTTYLLYFDGLYGTKSSFTITLIGPALPLILSDFHGETNKTFNNLFVELQSVSGDMSMIVERSADGIAFQPLGPIAVQQRSNLGKYKYIDASPLNGDNYYRLKIIGPDGSFEYSKVVLLQINLAGQVLVYPNPVRDHLNINLSFLQRDRYSVTISDAAGRTLYNEKWGPTNVAIPFTKQPAGNYFVQVRDSRNTIIALSKFVVGK